MTNHYWVISRTDGGDDRSYRYLRVTDVGGCPTWTDPCAGLEIPADAMRFNQLALAEIYAKPLREHGWDCEVVQIKILRGSTEMGV